MSLLISKFIKTIDAKDRVSLPPDFRSVLMSEGSEEIILYPSIRNQCIEGCGISRFLEISNMIEQMSPYSNERDALEFAIFGNSTKIILDKQGRMTLSKKLIKEFFLEKEVIFIGKGKFFEIWSQDALNAKSALLKKVDLQKSFIGGV